MLSLQKETEAASKLEQQQQDLREREKLNARSKVTKTGDLDVKRRLDKVSSSDDSIWDETSTVSWLYRNHRGESADRSYEQENKGERTGTRAYSYTKRLPLPLYLR
jgi:hypothetical protein